MNIIEKAVKLLKAGKPVIYPTETCYGIGCSALNEKAVKNIFRLKKREKNKPVPVLVSSISMWKKIAKPNKKALELAKKHWPGPLTIVTDKREIIPDIVNKTEIACRISLHYIPNQLIRKCGFPIVSTSANISGKTNPYEIKDCIKGVFAIDIGKLPRIKPTTIIDARNMKLYRRGNISL